MSNQRKMGQDFADLKKAAREIPGVSAYLNSYSAAIGNLVFARRMQLGINQSELAEMAKSTQATISRIEAGDEGIKSGTLNGVFKALGLTQINPIYSDEAATAEDVR